MPIEKTIEEYRGAILMPIDKSNGSSIRKLIEWNVKDNPSNSVVETANIVLGRIADFWSDLGPKVKVQDLAFLRRLYTPIIDNANNIAEQKKILDFWIGRFTADSEPLTLIRAALVASSYAENSLNEARRKDNDMAWRYVARAEYWLGIVIGTWSIIKDQPNSINDISKLGTAVRHSENHAMKADVFKWLDENRHKFKSMNAAAEAMANIVVPMPYVTVRTWGTAWNKLRSTGKL